MAYPLCYYGFRTIVINVKSFTIRMLFVLLVLLLLLWLMFGKCSRTRLSCTLSSTTAAKMHIQVGDCQQWINALYDINGVL
jgi:hypothetical protein